MSFFNNTFPEFVNQNPNWMKDYRVEEKGGLYRTIHCPVANSTAVYDACINVKTGDIYIGDDKGIIFFKHIMLTVARPIHTCVKTLWHASLIGPLAYEIFKLATGYFVEDPNGKYIAVEQYEYEGVEEFEEGDTRTRYSEEVVEGETKYVEDFNGSFVKKLLPPKYEIASKESIGNKFSKKYDWKGFRINLLHSCLDIVRTPLYGLAMTITYIFGIALTLLCCPSMLYRTRALAAKLERMLLRIKTRHEVYEQCMNGWVLHMCFHPAKNLAKSLNTGVSFPKKTSETLGNVWTIEKNLENYAENMLLEKKSKKKIKV